MGILEIGLRAPKIKAIVEVVDQDGKPVEGAVVRMPISHGLLGAISWIFRIDRRIFKTHVEAKTPASGIVKLSGRRYKEVSLSVEKPGYYPARVFYYDPQSFYTGTSAGKLPFPTGWKTVRLQLKQVRNPIPMYVFATASSGPDSVLRWRFPADKPEGPVGFDFFEHDLVAPHGKGVVPDVLLSRERAEEAEGGDYLVMRFVNPMDGIAGPFDDLLHSKFVSNHEAPAHGYTVEQRFENMTRRNFLLERSRKSGAALPFPGMRWYAIRLRSKVDGNGNLQSCHYGKITGYPNLTPMLVKPHTCSFSHFCYYINPTPNSRNLEWDMKTNLFEGVHRLNVPEEP